MAFGNKSYMLAQVFPWEVQNTIVFEIGEGLRVKLIEKVLIA